MGRALLVNPSYVRTYGSKKTGFAFPVYPILALSTITGALKQRGHEAKILDLSYREYDPDLIAGLVRDYEPDLVGVTATTPLMNQARDISFLVKEVSPETTTIAGGAHPSALPRQTLRESALDLVAQGEADYVIADLLDGRPAQDVGGIYRRTAEDIEYSGPATLIGDLDDLPMPAWEDYPLDGNAQIPKIISKYRPVTTVEFSRGCIYKCDFCGSKNTMGRGYRKKSPERCAEELARIAALGYREVVVNDDIFTTDNAWASAVCEEIIRRDIDIAWTCNNGIRVDSANPELFEVMKAAGCYRVYFGLETGNEAVLKSFGKGGQASIDKGVEAVRMARDAELEPNGFFMVGLMPDTEESMQDTIDYAKRLPLDTMKCGICVPYPGTPMFNELHRQQRIKTFDWDAYTVFNKADTIFDHPNLSWPVINSYFDRFYREAYFKNPGYIWRRLRFMLKNHQVLDSLSVVMKMRNLISDMEDGDLGAERYAYESRWRPMDTPLDEPIEEYEPPIPRRRGTAVALARGRR